VQFAEGLRLLKLAAPFEQTVDRRAWHYDQNALYSSVINPLVDAATDDLESTPSDPGRVWEWLLSVTRGRLSHTRSFEQQLFTRHLASYKE
jgi:hypothetical protein